MTGTDLNNRHVCDGALWEGLLLRSVLDKKCACKDSYQKDSCANSSTTWHETDYGDIENRAVTGINQPQR